jgi:hypothetical protein
MPNSTGSVYHGECGMPKKITLRFIGAPSDRENVRLSDFIAQLESVKKALRENERLLTGEDEPSLDYKITDLRHSSPAEMDLEPVRLRDVPKSLGSEVFSVFGTELRTIRKEAATTQDPELGRLQAYQEMGHRKNSALVALQIRVGRNKVAIDERFHGNLDRILGPDEFASGSISGFLEAINFHNTNRFFLYPTLGPKKVAGKFKPELRSDVKKAIGEFVTVEGRLAYKSWAPFPHAVEATRIVMHPPDRELPTLFDLKGTIPDLTGAESSVEFVDRIRNENW